MSSIEKDRKELTITGYVHPTTTSSNKNVYKTFNTESKGEYYVSAKTKFAYATFTSKNDSMKQSQGCPYCGEDALYECDCELKDKQCSKGHVWYINREGHIKRGDPHD